MTTSRRSFLKKGSGAVLSLSIQGGPFLLANRQPRVGIIGGGLAGVSCSWLLDGVADAVLFESRPILGGHAHTIPLVVDGQEIQVDVGAQFFARGPHPTYSRLLEVLGLLTPDQPDDDLTVEADMTITVTEIGRRRPRFVSPAEKRAWPVLAPWNFAGLWAFLVFAVAARSLSENGDWLVPLDAWLQKLPVRPEELERLLLPLVSAMVGCSIEQARGLSARSAVAFVAEALPENLLDPFRYSNSLLGLGGNIDYLARDSHNLTMHLGSPVTGVLPLGSGGYSIRNAAGVSEEVDIVFFAAPPYVTGPLLSHMPQLEKAAEVLEKFEYFTSEIAIHRDPIYMPKRRSYWSAYNPQLANGYCEASVWYGALRTSLEGQRPLRLFKSWATARSRKPREKVLRRRFRHPLINPDFILAQRELAAYQGWGGVWFVGSYTKEVDSQETALTSATDVVEKLYPSAPNLLKLL